MRIVLTQDQLADVDSVAERVHVRYQSVVRSRFSPKDIQELRREGFRAELALSLVLGLAWNRGDPQLADVGTMDEARWTRRRNPELRVYDPADSQDRGHMDRRFWLVTGFGATKFVRGWLYGQEVLDLGERRKSPEGTWSWFASTDLLRPVPVRAELPDRLCPSCHVPHPPLTTCAWGWSPA